MVQEKLLQVESSLCHICGQPAEYECEQCGELYCDNCGATYNRFSQIDYNCCKECQEYIEKHENL